MSKSINKSTSANPIKLTTRGRHAIMALIELMKKSGDNPVPLSEIADSVQISLSYLEQLFAGLRRNGLVKSYRGPGGGYILARPANEILVSEVFISAEDCVPAKKQNGSDKPEFANPQTRALWEHIGEILHVYLKQLSLEDVANDNLDAHPLKNKLFEILQ